MNRLLLSMTLLLGLFAVNTCAQEVKRTQTLTQPAMKHPIEKSAPTPALKPSENALGQHITYGGYIVDVLKAKDKHALFDLKQPLDPQKDVKNLWFIPGADVSSTVILFRIKH